jgi:hypothetical protein
MTRHITLEDRDALFEASRALVAKLVERLSFGAPSIDVDERLLRRLERACIACPGFSEAQKDDVAFLLGKAYPLSGLVPFADHWSVLKTLGPKPGVALDVLEVRLHALRL